MEGALGYDDDRVTFDDALSETVDTYTASRHGTRLTLTFASTTGQQVLDGIPTEAYSYALFSRPLAAVDCTPADLDACL